VNATSQGARAVIPAGLQAVHDLGGDEDDAERDHRLDRRSRHVHPAERRGRERQAVRDREGGDGGDEPAAAAHDQEQGEHEQQMVDAAEDVLDAEHQVGAGDLHRARGGLDRELRSLRQETLDLARSVLALDANDHVGDTAGNAVDGERLAGEPPARRIRQRST
jgi:hypothetical protein